VTPVERARQAVRDLLAAYQEASTTTEREDVARLIGLLTPNGGRSIAELAEAALTEGSEP
jgi:hypothetical protein